MKQYRKASRTMKPYCRKQGGAKFMFGRSIPKPSYNKSGEDPIATLLNTFKQIFSPAPNNVIKHRLTQFQPHGDKSRKEVTDEINS